MYAMSYRMASGFRRTGTFIDSFSRHVAFITHFFFVSVFFVWHRDVHFVGPKSKAPSKLSLMPSIRVNNINAMRSIVDNRMWMMTIQRYPIFFENKTKIHTHKNHSTKIIKKKKFIWNAYQFILRNFVCKISIIFPIFFSWNFFRLFVVFCACPIRIESKSTYFAQFTI